MAEYRLTGGNFRSLMESFLIQNSVYRVKVRGRGYSMSPFIKDDGILILRPVCGRSGIKFGDVVAVPDYNDGKILIHRVIGSGNGQIQLKGDNNREADGWYPKSAVIGIVDEIQGNGRIPYSGRHWQNVVIAVGSKTGLLTYFLSPAFRFVRNWVR